MRLARGILADHYERHLSGPQLFHTLGAGNHFAPGREDAGNPHEIALGNFRGTQRQLKTGQFFAVLSYTFSKEHPLCYEHSASCFLLEGWIQCVNLKGLNPASGHEVSFSHGSFLP
jgi:hypothetical protein